MLLQENKTLILRRDRKLLLPKRRWRAQPFFVTERHNLSFMCHCYWSQYFKGKERGGGGVWGHFMNHIEQKIKMNILSLFSQTRQSFLKHRYNPIYNFLNWSLPSTVGYLRFWISPCTRNNYFSLFKITNLCVLNKKKKKKTNLCVPP